MYELLTFIVTGILSYLGVAWFERWSRKRDLLDIPNHRSSHEVPTPRGAGIVIVALILMAFLSACWLYSVEISWSYLIGGALVAAISWLDDVRSVSFIYRFLVHSVAAGMVLFELGYWNQVDLPLIDSNVYFGVAGIAITFLWIVWVINAYNFMDGIDGIAGIQACAASGGWLLVAIWLTNPLMALFSAAVFGSSLGFLLHNWHPARVFLGDVGSAFLGFTFAVMPLLMARNQSIAVESLPIFAILFLWPFVFDTALTFARRLLRGDKVWTAHREHLYQRMVRSGHKHNTVSKMYGLAASLIIASILAAVINRSFFEIVAVLVTFSMTVLLIIVSLLKKRLT